MRISFHTREADWAGGRSDGVCEADGRDRLGVHLGNVAEVDVRVTVKAEIVRQGCYRSAVSVARGVQPRTTPKSGGLNGDAKINFRLQHGGWKDGVLLK